MTQAGGDPPGSVGAEVWRSQASLARVLSLKPGGVPSSAQPRSRNRRKGTWHQVKQSVCEGSLALQDTRGIPGFLGDHRDPEGPADVLGLMLATEATLHWPEIHFT